MVPADERNDLISAYHKRLFSGDMQEETRFARAWAGWESALASLDRGMTRGGGSGSYARAFARLENHYFTHEGFLEEDGQVLRDLHKIEGIPGVIVQGRYDMICPPATAHKIAANWKSCDLRMVTAAGHALSEPGIASELVAVVDSLREG
jgi:proline iminopeptidase